MSSEQSDESSDADPPTPSDGTKSTANRKRPPTIAEASGYTTLLIIIGLISGVISPPANLILAGIGTLIALVYYFWHSKHPSLLRVLAIFVVAALGVTGGYFGRPLIDYGWQQVTGECEDPVELTVLLPVDGASGFAAGIERFNERYLDGSGCKRANVTAYSAPWPKVQTALGLGWKAEEGPEEDHTPDGFVPQRDVGPRPDLWLAESAAQVELAEGLLDGAGSDDVLDADEAEPIGWTPLVVAVPDQVFNTAFSQDGQILDESPSGLVQRLGDEYGLSVVRADPTLSHTALSFLEYLYDDESSAVGVQIEKQLARSVEDIGVGLPGTDTSLICKLTDISSSGAGTAVLTTERALAQHNSGAPLGDGCPLNIGSRSGYSPLYLEALGSLDYQAVRLGWEDPWAERRSEVAADLTDWLAGGDEAWSPEQIGIRGNGYDGSALEGERNFALSFESAGEPIEGDEIEALLRSYSESRVPTNVLLAIDGSQSMGTQIGGEGRSRFELAVEGVRAALENLGPHDKAGLWTFPAEGGAAYDELLPIDSGYGPQEAGLLTGHQPVTGVDLHRTLVEGLAALEEAEAQEEARGEEDSVDAMVVLTDGADSDVDVGEVIDRATAAEVSLYIIAVGDASCRARHFAELTVSPRVNCLEAGEDRIKTTFDSLFGQLWS